MDTAQRFTWKLSTLVELKGETHTVTRRVLDTLQAVVSLAFPRDLDANTDTCL